MIIFCYCLAGMLNVFWLALGDKLSLWVQLSVPVVSVGLVAIGAVLRVSQLGERPRKRYLRRVLWVVLLYYLAILSVLLFFGGLFHVERSWGGAVNLEPFRAIRNFLRHYRRTGSWSSFFNLLGNTVLLLPLGVLLPVMFRHLRRFWIFLPLAALVCVGVEYIQWRTATGVADIDDCILNFAGAAVGYFMTRLCQIIYGYIRKRKQNG
jgi:glycopeptide antibiotics resistance protein